MDSAIDTMFNNTNPYCAVGIEYINNSALPIPLLIKDFIMCSGSVRKV